MNFIGNLIPQSLVYSFGWTIIHSFWQGAIIAICLEIVLYFLKNSSARTRYAVSLVFSILLVISSVITFINYLDSSEGLNISNYSFDSYKTVNISSEKNAAQGSYYSKSKSAVVSALSLSSQYHYYITAIWMFGAILLLIKFLAGLAFQRYIRNSAFNMNSEFQSIADNAMRKLNYKGSIPVVESIKSKVPMVIGYFKPVILLPVGIFTGLSSEQIELILAHEIAHIIRKDTLVNIFLVITEIVFFYNPAFWWISSKIKFERECSCDDLAMSTTNYPFDYAKALAAVLENSLSVPHYSLALFNRKSHALKRVERVIKPSGMQPSFKEGSIILLVLVMSMFVSITAKVNSRHVTSPSILAIDTNRTKTGDSIKKAETKTVPKNIKSGSATDTTKSGNSSDEYVVRKFGTGTWDGKGVNTDRGSYKHVTLQWKNNIVTRLSIDGKEINPRDFRNYPDLIYFDEHMPSFDFRSGHGKKRNYNYGNGSMSAGQMTIGNKTYNHVQLIWKNYTPVYLVVEGKEIDKADYGKYSDIIDSHIEKRPNANPEIK
ncbi:MAG: M48 family metalloprotease [Ignavibacteria bacterium]|jgi:beta-lactamase regulating signal transducer with metallopeptidase domain|nr:M48 family metalloprotease [Ignavibacteria bacterium]MCU7520500.1 M48 family metalloprotease [Ignavibacteria bacterium]